MSTIVLPERFDFSYHATFSEAYPKVLDSGNEDLILDFSKVSYIDSSALGMMVLVNKKAKAKGRSVIIQNATGAALEVLTIANFQQMFTFK